MELRLLESEAERAQFEHALTQARATRGSGFMEKRRSRLGRVHMAFADLWAVYDETSSTPDRMLAGIAMHSLDLFSQSYPNPTSLTCRRRRCSKSASYGHRVWVREPPRATAAL
jgi:hypothetical protein